MRSYVRQLDEYPTGKYRIKLLAMAVIAILIASYEAQIAAIVPLLLSDLDMSLATYGSISAVGLLAGAIAGFIGGRCVDTIGRVKLLVPLMALTAILSLLTALVSTPGQFFVARAVLAFVDGLAAASTAPLIRDLSPRTGRATAFGFWTWGPVGANFIAAAIAALTLPLFHDAWQSQFIIMGSISFVLSIVIAFNIAELSPRLRATILQTERRALGIADEQKPARVRDLARHGTVWAHCLGISMWLVLYLTLVIYGQTMLIDTFGVSASEASRVMSVFWILNLVTLIVAGRISDRLQLRRPISFGGTIASMVVIGVLITLVSDPENTSTGALMITGLFLGGALGTAYAPWLANYSENAEDIDPRLQGTAFGMFSAITKIVSVVVALVVPRIVGETSWRTWLFVAMACMALFAVAGVFFRGPWRRPRKQDLGVPASADSAVVPVQTSAGSSVVDSATAVASRSADQPDASEVVDGTRPQPRTGV